MGPWEGGGDRPSHSFNCSFKIFFHWRFLLGGWCYTPGPMRCYSVKESHIGSVASEILRYTHTDWSLFLIEYFILLYWGQWGFWVTKLLKNLNFLHSVCRVRLGGTLWFSLLLLEKVNNNFCKDYLYQWEFSIWFSWSVGVLIVHWSSFYFCRKNNYSVF